MMRKLVLLISLLLVSFLNDHQAQGIRLIERSLSANEEHSGSSSNNNLHVEEKSDLTTRNSVRSVARPAGTAKEEEDDHGSETAGPTRKLMTKTSSTFPSTTTSKNYEKNDEEGNPSNEAEPTPSTVEKGQSTTTRQTSVPRGKEENFTVNSSSTTTRTGTTEHPLSSPETSNVPADDEQYPDILDIAGMDYSPARRKPPIHN